jgi:hypothetical protein
MCDPVSLSIAGGVVSAVGSIFGGFQQGAAYDDQARFAARQAVMEGQAGAYERERLKSHNTRALSGMRQQYVSAGIDPNSGSARAVIEDSAREAALDEEAILFGAKVRADNRRFEARLARSTAQSARIGGFLGAAANILGGFTQAGDFNSRRTVLTNPYVAYGRPANTLGGLY